MAKFVHLITSIACGVPLVLFSQSSVADAGEVGGTPCNVKEEFEAVHALEATDAEFSVSIKRLKELVDILEHRGPRGGIDRECCQQAQECYDGCHQECYDDGGCGGILKEIERLIHELNRLAGVEEEAVKEIHCLGRSLNKLACTQTEALKEIRGLARLLDKLACRLLHNEQRTSTAAGND